VPQVVPRVIWQTWKDTHPGPRRFEGMSSIALVNPEYDYVLFTDKDCSRFMCELADPETRLAYEVCVQMVMTYTAILCFACGWVQARPSI